MIPLHRPHLTGRELQYVAQAAASGRLGGDGPFTQRCQRLLARRFDLACVLMTQSGTAALEIAAALCGLGPGDEAVVPAFTFVSTANAVLRTGARPVFADVRPDTLNVDVEQIERVVTPRVKAVFVVHYGGVACELDAVLELARRRGLYVVEDAAQAVDAFYHGRALGGWGDAGCYSFHETKNATCGEGGALCVNRPEWRERAEIIREKGTNRSQFLRGETDHYTWLDAGSSYAPSEVLCAFLCAQLERLDEIAARRRALWERYGELLAPLEGEGLLRLPVVPPGRRANWHMMYVLLPDRAARDAAIRGLRAEGVMAAFHFLPLHCSPMGRKLGGRPGDCPVAEQAAGRLLRLPLYEDLQPGEQERVAELLGRILRGRRRTA